MEESSLSPGEFGAAFKGFLEQSVAQAPAPEEPYFPRRFREHFGTDPSRLPVVSYEVEPHDHPNLQLALDAYAGGDGRTAEYVGLSTTQKRYTGVGLSEIVSATRSGLWGDTGPRPGPVEFADVALDAGRTLSCLKSGLVLMSGDAPLAVFVNSSEMGSRAKLTVEAMARERETAEAFLAELRTSMRVRNVYRGRVITLEQRQSYAPLQVRFHRLAPVAREDIVLPAGVLERVERQTIDFSEHVEQLRRAGQHVKRGLLLHGPPGSGKTLTARYLAGRMPDRTVVILTGGAIRLIETACALARVLQPSTVILEDVDLIAEERTRDGHPALALLFELLNQMDGMEEDADVLFLLTTNRPDLLEPALAARPGRVDLAVEIPLPDATCRRRLLELYAGPIETNLTDVDRLVERTRNVSAAFIRELVRKAALAAADENGGSLVLRDRHIDDALQELMFEGGELTRSLLGGAAAQT